VHTYRKFKDYTINTQNSSSLTATNSTNTKFAPNDMYRKMAVLSRSVCSLFS